MGRMARIGMIGAISALFGAGLSGCASGGSDLVRAILPDRQRPGVADARGDAGGPLYYSVSVDLLKRDQKNHKPLSQQMLQNTEAFDERLLRLTEQGRAGQLEVEPDELTANGTEIRNPQAGSASGKYLTVGGVVAEVNGNPIFANEVLAVLESPLAARAQDLGPATFRAYAREEIRRQIDELIDVEVWVAAAERNLGPKDKMLAEHVTVQWRQQQIRQAGGSLELARRRAQAEGQDFDQMVRHQHRMHLVMIFQERRILPHIDITPSEMLAYYERNVQREFTEHDRMRFRAIRIDPGRIGGRAAALSKAEQLYARAVAGEDFAALAGEFNHEQYLLSRNGDVGWIDRGAYAVRPVEEAVRALQPGEVTEIIDTGSAFYIAMLEQYQPGRVKPFEEEEVQQTIRRQLASQQRHVLHQQVHRELEAAAVMRHDEQMIETAVEMAMQKYPYWAEE